MCLISINFEFKQQVEFIFGMQLTAKSVFNYNVPSFTEVYHHEFY